MKKIKSDNIIFIVGVGRSGTTLLQCMLNEHTNISFIPEINYIRRFLASNHLEKIYKNGGKTALITTFENDRLLQRLEFNWGKVLNSSFDNSSNLCKQVYESILAMQCEIDGKNIAGDKDPRSIEFLPLINRLFPNSIVIHIVRDPRDILLSKSKAEWSKKRLLITHIFANKVQLLIFNKYRHLFGDRLIEIKYEDLITNPKAVLVNICFRMNIDFEEKMLLFSDSAEKLISADELQWKEQTFKPLMSSNMNKWEKGLSQWSIKLVEENVHIAFNEYKYKKSDIHFPFYRLLYIKGLSLLLSLASLAYLVLNLKKNNA